MKRNKTGFLYARHRKWDQKDRNFLSTVSCFQRWKSSQPLGAGCKCQLYVVTAWMFFGLAWIFKLLPSKHTETSILSHKLVKVEGNDSVRMTQRFKLHPRPCWQHHGTWVPGLVIVMTGVLGMVYKHWKGQYRSETKVGLQSFCLSQENSGSQIMCQVIAPTCPCLSSNFVSVNIWSSAYIEYLYTEGWTLLYIHLVC